MMKFLNRYRFALIVPVAFLLFACHALYANVFHDTAIFAKSPAAAMKQDAPILNCPQQISFGDVVECAINQPTETQVYNFSANDGDRLQLILHNNTLIRTALRIEIHQVWDGRRICSRFSSAYKVEIENCAISATGEYQAWVYDSERDETANYRFTLRRLSDLPQNSAIADGEVVAGSVDSEFQISIYPFEGLEGERVQVPMRNETLPLAPLIMEIRNTWDYERLGSGCRRFSSATALDIDNCLLPEDGTYQLWVYEFENDDSAQFQFSLQRLNARPIASTLDYGTVVSGRLSDQLQIDVYAFQGTPDENVAVYGWNDTLVRQPLRAEIRNTWDYKRLSGACDTFSSAAQFDIDNCSLPEVGTYQLWIYDSEYDDSLDYRICVTTVGGTCVGDAPQPTLPPTLPPTLSPTPTLTPNPTATPPPTATETQLPNPTATNPPPTATATPLPSPTPLPTVVGEGETNCSTEIAYGETVACSIGLVGEMDTFTFQGEAGDNLLAIGSNVSDSEMWVASHINDVSSGEQLCHNNGIGFIFAEIDNCILPQDGEYQLVVRDLRASFTGDYELNLQRLNPVVESVPIALGQVVSNELSGEADVRFFTYSGDAGEIIRITVNELPARDFNPRIEVRDSNTKAVICWSWGPFGAFLKDCVLPADGEYLIAVRDAWHDEYGEFTIHITCADDSCRSSDVPGKPLVIIYAVLDNNLGNIGNTWERLVNNAEAGVHEGINVALLIDGPETDDSYAYALMSDDDPTCPNQLNPKCDDRYVEDQSFWIRDENTAHAETLRQFILDANQHFPDSTSIILSLVGHGNGWSANFLPGQPSRWVPQSTLEYQDRVGGLLWDDNPGNGGTSRSMSTRMLGYTLEKVSAEIGKPFDLIYLDACSMGMAEVAYELRNSTNHLLASANTAWTSFAYDKLLAVTNPEDSGLAIGKDWLAAEAETLEDEGYPFTLALLDLTRMTELADSSSALGGALIEQLAEHQELIQLAYDRSERYESDYNGSIDDNQDTYVDLGSFVNQLEGNFPDQADLLSITTQVKEALEGVVVNRRMGSGHPWLYPDNDWTWAEAWGLAIYLPLKSDEIKRNLYTDENLTWAAATRWDEFLDAFWGNGVAAADLLGGELPTCESTKDGCQGLAAQLSISEEQRQSQSIFLPLVQ